MPSRTLIAIGGGGATHGTHSELDRLCIGYTDSRRRIGYIGTASGDDLEKHRRFRDGFTPLAGTISKLSNESDQDQARIWADGLDLIYVGGGNPTLLVDHWNATGIGTVLVDAFRRGVTLAGVSAGAMCRFESFLWRSREDGLQASEGLGIVRGSMTPHSRVEPDRRARMHGLVTRGAMPEGYAVDDGAALVMREGDPVLPYPSEGPPFVYRIRRKDGETVLNP
ncbi:MAG: Type 1 glutamine amidotransferase-like domain-containing protein [Boseongicola sp.]|nr:Type 1 glutamine amidotransferase-like domain-containing protein [Boseongicola sp.]